MKNFKNSIKSVKKLKKNALWFIFRLVKMGVTGVGVDFFYVDLSQFSIKVGGLSEEVQVLREK